MLADHPHALARGVVAALVKGFPWWPAHVFTYNSLCEAEAERQEAGGAYCCFFRENNWCWVKGADKALCRPLRGGGLGGGSRLQKRVQDALASALVEARTVARVRTHAARR